MGSEVQEKPKKKKLNLTVRPQSPKKAGYSSRVIVGRRAIISPFEEESFNLDDSPEIRVSYVTVNPINHEHSTPTPKSKNLIISLWVSISLHSNSTYMHQQHKQKWNISPFFFFAINNRHLFSHSSGGWKFKIKMPASSIGFLWGLSPSLAGRHLLAASSHGLFLWPWYLSYKDMGDTGSRSHSNCLRLTKLLFWKPYLPSNLHGLGSAHMTSFYLNFSIEALPPNSLDSIITSFNFR